MACLLFSSESSLLPVGVFNLGTACLRRPQAPITLS
jgi:hypothetical protein